MIELVYDEIVGLIEQALQRYVMLLEIFLGFLATLSATLTGVWIAFWLDRRAERRQTKRRVLQHLRAIQNELEINDRRVRGAMSVIQTLQRQSEREATHYVVNPYSTDAWDAALENELIEVLPSDTYHSLQNIYADMKSTNELIKTLRAEPMHPKLGNKREQSSHEIWTYSVTHYDEDKEEVELSSLGPLIRERSHDIIGQIVDLRQEIDEQIDRLEEELDEEEKSNIDTNESGKEKKKVSEAN